MGQHRSRDFWSALVAEYEQVAATQTLRSFAKRRGVSEKSLTNWRSKLRRESSQANEAEQQFVPVVVRSVARDHGAEVVIRFGPEPRIEVIDHQRVPVTWIAELAREFVKVSG